MASPADNGGHFPDRAYLSLTGGTLTGLLTGTSITLTGVLKVPQGTVGAPSIADSTSPTTGIYFAATDQIKFTAAGALRFSIDGGNSIVYSASGLRGALNGAGALYASGGASATILCDGTGVGSITTLGGVLCLGSHGYDAGTAIALNIGKNTATSVVITPATTITGALTPSGGVASATTAITTATVTEYAGFAPPPTLTTGTDTAMANGTSWFAPVYIGTNRTLTGIGYLVGSVGGTDSVITALYTASGQAAALANSNLAGTVVGTAATFQEVPFTATYAAKCGWYWALIQANGATAKLRLGVANGTRGGTVAGVFATLPATLTLPTTNVAAPICYVY